MPRVTRTVSVAAVVRALESETKEVLGIFDGPTNVLSRIAIGMMGARAILVVNRVHREVAARQAKRKKARKR